MNLLPAIVFLFLFAAAPLAVLSAETLEDVRKSAEQGDSKSQFSMGQRYEAGKGGVERDLDKAVGWYRKAAEQGHALAQHGLGFMYLEGECVAKDGAEAVRIATTEDIDVILMDIHMPELDGLQATSAIREIPGGRAVPIIAMTANAMRQDVDRCLAAGMDDYIAKPVVFAKLFEKIEALLRLLSPMGVKKVARSGMLALYREPD